MLGERRDDIHIAGMAGDGERIQVRVQVALGLVFGVEVNVQHLNAHVRKVLAEEGQGLRTVDELDLQLLEGMHMDDALQELEDDQHDHAGDQCDFRKAVTRRKADTRHAPQGSRGGQAGDPPVGNNDIWRNINVRIFRIIRDKHNTVQLKRFLNNTSSKSLLRIKQ